MYDDEYDSVSIVSGDYMVGDSYDASGASVTGKSGASSSDTGNAASKTRASGTGASVCSE